MGYFPATALKRWGLLLAASAATTIATTTPLPPTQDPFYTAPAGFEHVRPGAVLRVRSAPGNLTAIVANSSEAYNILYRTTDSLNKPSWAVTTLFAPLSHSHGHGNSLLSYQIAYDSPSLDASPSYGFYSSGQELSSALPDISAALGRGWYVNVPDYEGPLAAFTAGLQSGHAVLDSVRAVLSAGLGGAAGLSPHARPALWGYSGGGLATGWAVQLQEQYAPDLNLAGSALGAPVSNLTEALEVIGGTWAAGLAPLGLLGLVKQYPDASRFLVSQLKPTGPHNRTSFLAAGTMTWVEGLAAFNGQDVYDYFVNGLDALRAPPLAAIFAKEGVLGNNGRVPKRAPLFVYKAIGDDVTPIGSTDTMVEKWCAGGANILYQRNTIGNHITEAVSGDGRAFQWLSSVLDGTYGSSSSQYKAEGCTIETVTL